MSKILVVDEESGTTTLLERYLDSLGHDVTSTPSVLGALGRLDREDFDAVVIDAMGRGQVKALALCRVLKSDPRTSGTRVVIISPFEDTAKKAAAAGADAFIIKPFHLDDLRICLEWLARLGRASQPALYGLTIHDAFRAYGTGLMNWARGNA